MIKLLLACLTLFLLNGCVPERQGYLLSPQNASSNTYHVIPMITDSIRSSMYVSGIFSTGTANDHASDQVNMFQGSLHRSNHFGVFQSYYGVNFSLGSYHVKEYYNFNYDFNGNSGNPYIRDSSNHIPDSHQFFGSYGFSGGINIVTAHEHSLKYRHSEWRILGLETSLQNEFGSYSDMRGKLPDTAANVIFRKKFSAYLGLYTEWLWTDRHQIESGFKMAAGMDLNPGNCYTNYYAPSILPLYCFSLTYHVRKDRYTGFIQTNFGTYADNIQIGFSYRLLKSLN
jgi:hypothetical protein